MPNKKDNYWIQHYKESVAKNPFSPLKQIGKTVNGVEVGGMHLDLIVSQISNTINLSKSDTLADLGCGNGLLTVRFAEMAGLIIGIDVTEGLLEFARNHHSAVNVKYLTGNILTINHNFISNPNKIMMYEVLQHISCDDFSQILNNLNYLDTGTNFFVGGIPDKNKIKNFYDSDEKYAYYLSCENQGKPHLGRWWLESELCEISMDFGWNIEFLNQPENLYTSHYRFDVLLTKK